MTTAVHGLDIDHLRRWVGRRVEQSDVVTEDLVAKFTAMLDMPTAVKSAPPLLHFCLAQPAVTTAELAADGHPHKGGFLPPVPLDRRMWAGGTIAFHGKLHVGETITRVSEVAGVAVKQGKSGTLCFVDVQHTIVAGGTTLIEEVQNLVYRGAVLKDSRTDTDSSDKPRPEWHEKIVPSAALLFRYSALTFNGHRIHYDRRYATEVENYPGLVVHGPLQATLLCLFAARIRGADPQKFGFRSVRPVFDDGELTLNALSNGNGLSLWTADGQGRLATLAEASWT